MEVETEFDSRTPYAEVGKELVVAGMVGLTGTKNYCFRTGRCETRKKSTIWVRLSSGEE